MLQLLKNAHVQGSFLGYAKKHDEFLIHQRQISRQIASQPNLLLHGFVMNYPIDRNFNSIDSGIKER